MKFLLYTSYAYGFPIIRPLQEEILRRGFDAAWFIEIEENKNKLNPSEKLLNTVEEVINYKPDIVLVASNEVPHFFPGIKVQLFHGFSVNKRSKNKGHFRIRGFFDLYCTQGPSTTALFEQLAKKHKHFKVIETGWSKVDVLFIDKKEITKKKPVVFVASTFTEQLSLAHNNTVFKEIKRLIKSKDWKWIINLHPKMNPQIVEKFKDLDSFENVTYLPILETLEPLKLADVLLTDTSSIITEFIIQIKPVVTFNNAKPQDCFINIKSSNELEENLELAIDRTKEIIDKIKLFANEEHPYRDGKSAERVINASINFYKQNTILSLKAKPLNIIRKFKIRKSFNYYKL